MSLADLVQFASNVAIEFTGGPRMPFCYGRVDFDAESSQLDRLPEPENESTKDIFATMGKGRLGLTAEEIVAVLGAHTVGHMHKEASGHDGAWDATPFTWDIGYFV
jgi:catalase (peroxidase I)